MSIRLEIDRLEKEVRELGHTSAYHHPPYDDPSRRAARSHRLTVLQITAAGLLQTLVRGQAAARSVKLAGDAATIGGPLILFGKWAGLGGFAALDASLGGTITAGGFATMLILAGRKRAVRRHVVRITEAQKSITAHIAVLEALR